MAAGLPASLRSPASDRLIRRRTITASAFIILAFLTIVAPFALKAAVAQVELPPLHPPTGTLVLDRNGVLLRAFPVADGRWRLPATLADVDPAFIAALVAYEDKRFRSHRGVDVRALGRAALQLIRHRRPVSGGSTITMQVARLLRGRSTRSAGGKVDQILTALALERRLSKDVILDLYLKLAPYGGNVEGIRAASLAYLGKEPRRLTPAEAALLVALPQGPEARRPDRHPGRAQAARDRVLDRAEAAGILPAEDAAAARSEPVPSRRRPFPMLAAHSTARLAAEQPARRMHRLTVDAGLQTRLETLARERAEGMAEAVSVAILVADHKTGEILASVGASDLFDERRDGFIDMTRAIRSPGSTLKPLIYGLAFEGGIAHPETLIDDRPVDFAGYAPENFDREFHGTVSVRRALQLSLNIPAIELLEAVGPARLVARMRRAGAAPVLPDMSPPGLAVGLGGVGVTLTDLVAIHAAIARGGRAVPLRLDAERALDLATQPEVLESRAAWQVASILAGAAGPEGIAPGRIAFKTGTSYGYRDAWAIGFDGRHVIGVWVGRPDAAPVPGLVGIDAAAPILTDAFARIGEAVALPPAPPGILKAPAAGLPATLRRFRSPNAPTSAAAVSPEIAYPPAGVRVDLGIRDGDPMPLALKVRSGSPPYTWFVDGAPIGTTEFGNPLTWQPGGPGFVNLTVIDARGASSASTVFLEVASAKLENIAYRQPSPPPEREGRSETLRRTAHRHILFVTWPEMRNSIAVRRRSGSPYWKISSHGRSMAMTAQRLSVFPAFHKVSNRPVLVVGDGPQAAAKVRLIGETDAAIRLVAARPSIELAELAASANVDHIARPFQPGDLDAVVLVFAASGVRDRDAEVVAAARARNIPANAVDIPELCDFYTPALVNRAPVAVAITSTGAGPVLAQKLRARMEMLLPAKLGLLASLGESFRAAAERVLPQGQPRRRFWSAFFEGGIADAALAGRTDEARRLATRLLTEADGAENGFVWLVGAGPGAADLLTLRAQRILGEADVIVHDSLVPDAVVAMGRRDAERIDVGKRKGRHKATQAEINAILVREAGAGRRVARLKCGDPLVFGRAGEEMAALRQAGVPFEIVPGVTSALAAAAEAEIPLTMRGAASTLVFTTGHDARGDALPDWAALAVSGATVAVYMGRSVAARIAGQLSEAGLPATTPVAVLENASLPSRRILYGILADLGSLEERSELDGPALIIIGAAAAEGALAAAEPLVPARTMAA